MVEFAEVDFHTEYDGIIGNNILEPLKAIIDYENRTLKTRRSEIQFFINKEEEKYFSCCKNQTTIDIFSNEVNSSNLLEFIETSHLNEEERTMLHKVILHNKNVFYKDGDNLSFTSHIKHEIKTKNEIPIYSKLYRYPEIHKNEVNKQIEEMLKINIIQPSSSPYNSPIWVVPKKIDNSREQKWRIVVDYRKLNQTTIDDKFPIPNIDDIFDKLGKANYFTTLDLAKGFHQIEVSPKDRPKTAFSTANGHFEFLRMPFGLKNGPATFQRLINDVLREFINAVCVVYMDDILIFATSLQEHLESISKILKKLSEVNLKVQLNKCSFLKRETEFLGHIVTDKGIKPNPNKIESILKIPLPKNQKEIKSFLGITGFYRKFIRDYSKVAHPLIKYLRKGMKINLNDKEYQNAFEKLKKLLTSDPILAYPDFEKLFTLTTDASDFALGAVLSQNSHPISYISRTLNKHERNYSTIEKELLSIVWATKVFRPYLFGRKFTIKTDHRPLVWLNGLKEPNSKLQRYKIRLNEFDFDIEYVKGKQNFVADGLSRIKLDSNECPNNSKSDDLFSSCLNINSLFNDENFNKEVNKNLNNNEIMSISEIEKNNDQDRIICDETISVCSDVKIYPGFYNWYNTLHNEHANNIKINESRNNDEIISTVATIHSALEDSSDLIYITEKPINIYKNQLYLEEGDKEKYSLKIVNKKCQNKLIVPNKSNLVDQLKRIFPDKGLVCVHCDNITLFLKFQDVYQKYFSSNKNLTVLKSSKKLTDISDKNEIINIIKEEHLRNNHRGINEVFNEIKEKYYYPNLLIEITKVISNCETCNLAKHDRSPPKIPLKVTENPENFNDIVHMDIWFPERNKPYLTTVDKFSKYASIHKLDDRTWISILKAIKERIRYLGKMRKLISDGERCIIHNAVELFLRENDITFHQTTASNKTGNSDVERLHGTLNEHMRIINTEGEIKELDDKIFKIMNSYNNTIHSTTNFRPIDFLQKNFNKNDIKNLSEKLAKEKQQKIDKLNSSRDKNPKISENIVKNRNIAKNSPKYKRIKVYTKDKNYITDKKDKRNVRYYKSQLKRKFKHKV